MSLSSRVMHCSGFRPSQVVCWCDRFELNAECTIGGESRTLQVRSGAPIFPAAPPRRFNSKLEARFARDFARLAPDWDVRREPPQSRPTVRPSFPTSRCSAGAIPRA